MLSKGGPAPRKGMFEGRSGGVGLSRCRSGAARRGTDGGVRGPSLRRPARGPRAPLGGSAFGLVVWGHVHLVPPVGREAGPIRTCSGLPELSGTPCSGVS